MIVLMGIILLVVARFFSLADTSHESILLHLALLFVGLQKIGEWQCKGCRSESNAIGLQQLTNATVHAIVESNCSKQQSQQDHRLLNPNTCAQNDAIGHQAIA